MAERIKLATRALNKELVTYAEQFIQNCLQQKIDKKLMELKKLQQSINCSSDQNVMDSLLPDENTSGNQKIQLNEENLEIPKLEDIVQRAIDFKFKAKKLLEINFPDKNQINKLDPSQLQKGLFNKGIVLQLKCSCPPLCSCKEKKVKLWYHKNCCDPSFINEFGDIFCWKANSNKDCKPYFIQHARFQCSELSQGWTWEKYNSVSQVSMAIAQGLQTAEMQLDEISLLKFCTNLNMEIMKRWNK